jgi:peptidoglycan/xylan/chitin deacetylase (PgdA/CDA1 family)
MLSSGAVAPPVLSSVTRAIKQSLFTVGYYHQRLAHAAFPGVAVLCYHNVRSGDGRVPFHDLHVAKAAFERHCRLIADACHPISLVDLRDARAGTRSLPPRSVLVTFDDGYRGVADFALPILERYGIPAVVFVCVAPVLSGRHFWFDAMYRRDGEAAVLRARSLPYADWRALAESTETRAEADEAHRPLTPSELRRLAASPLIEIGAHTITHPTLALAPIDDQRREIAQCRSELERALGRRVTAFAYPYGSLLRDYTSQTVSLVREAGFDLAFATTVAFAAPECDPLQIPRFTMLDSVGDVELAHRLVRSWYSTVS